MDEWRMAHGGGGRSADEGLLSDGRGKDEKARRRLKTCRLLAAGR